MPATTNRAERAEVVELRVHGVGGASAQQLLQARGDFDVVQVEGDGTSGFFRLRHPDRADRVAEAYVWGGLNSKALISGLWWLLLPFTLVNLAGWMLGRTGRGDGVGGGSSPSDRPLATKITRGLVRLGGAGLTIVYVLYLLVLVVDVTAVRCGSDPACSRSWWLAPLRWFPTASGVGHPVWRAAAGLSIVLAVVGVLFGASARNRRLHETVGAVPGGGRAWGQTVPLTDPTFWYQLSSPGALYRLHLGAATATLGFATGTTLAPATAEHGWPDDPALRAWLVVLAGLWCLVIGLLARPDRFAWRNGRYVDRLRHRDGRFGFRSAVVGWGLLHIGLVALAGSLGWAWRQDAPTDDTFAVHGFVDLIWWAALIGVLPFIVLLLMVVVVRQGGRNRSYLRAFVRQLWKGFDELTEAATVRDAPPHGFRIYPVPVALGLALILVFAGFSAVLVRTISFLENPATTVPLGTDRIGGNPSFFAFSAALAGGVVAIWYRRPSARRAARSATEADHLLDAPDSPRQERWISSVALARLNAGLGRRADVVISLLSLVFGVTLLALLVRGGGAESSPLFGWEWLESIGSWVLVLFLFPGVFVLRAALRARDSRQTVGKVWDVLTFWPRLYHPLAAPCYAERAVPELRDRLLRLTEGEGRVILAAHSQGTVLGYAAIASLTGVPGGAERLERISIVTQGSPLRQLFVPFFPDYFRVEHLRSMARRCDDRGGWVNFYRDTDYIGQHLFAVPDGPDRLPDVAGPSDVRLLDPPCPYRPLRRHIDYEDETTVQRWLAGVAAGTAFSSGDRGPGAGDGPPASPGT